MLDLTEENELKSIKNSALWAAYGDALGFITELVDSKGLKRRINNSRVTNTVSWRRQLGGRFGAEVELPAGCYSDDTQLRLATSRAIRGDGEFDVETFAKVELPVWLSYSLGAGRGSKIAAASLVRQNINWFSNFFDQQNSRYIEGGGNGAAMRIQPIVWAAPDKSKAELFINNVVRNAICTHGHPRGILGAVFHALCLAYALEKNLIPGPDDWKRAIDFFPKVAELVHKDHELSSFWLPVWEERINLSIEHAFEKVEEECLADFDVVQKCILKKSQTAYPDLVEAIGGFDNSMRGSGTKTAMIASALCWMYQDKGPAHALEIAANLLFSDTDTIATMAGAILGVVADNPPEGRLLDLNYIEKEAIRLYRISIGESTESFSYPDLLKWQPPNTQQDAVGLINDSLALAGLGVVQKKGKAFESRGKDDAVWQWLELDFGQSVICKRRLHPMPMQVSNYPQKPMPPKTMPSIVKGSESKSHTPEQPFLFKSDVGEKKQNEKGKSNNSTVNEMTKEAINSGFDETTIGRHFLQLAEQPDGIEKAIVYAGIVIKAKMARLQSRAGAK